MAAPQNIVALVFDFDDTLTDDSTTQFLEAHGVDAAAFWQRTALLATHGWDASLAYTSVLLGHAGKGKPLGKLTNQKLRDFGAALRFYPGIPQLFTDLRAAAKQHPLSHPSVEFYVVSGGLEEIIRGSRIARHFAGIWGCRFAEAPGGGVRCLKNVVSFTDKTKFLFEINKGIVDPERLQPFAVNEPVADADRRIPFKNMIYVGDGLTDVPCFSLVKKFGGMAFGVFDPRREGSPKKAWEKLVAPQRVSTLNAPRYRRNDDLGAILRATVGALFTQMDSRTAQTGS